MIYALPFIAAAIGWVTNYIAVKMLFHPKKPVKLLFFTVQGIFPKRQAQLAESLGNVVATQLFSIQDIKEKLNDPSLTSHATTLVEGKIDNFLRNKLMETMPMLKMFVNDALIGNIKDTLVKEFEDSIPEILNGFADKLEEKVNIKEIVSQKVAAFSSDKFEEILFSIMKKEFKFIEIVGAVLGFLIGCIQLLLLTF
ncbi:MAG: DUF445 domain-containing protein [Cyclobacteriaceae bacterium]